jgi:hypothetical protein
MLKNTTDRETRPRDPGDTATAILLAAASMAESGTAALLALGARRQARGPGRAYRAWLTAIPIVIVNYVAFRAQLRFWQGHLDRPDALLVSVALESIAIYWAWQAHLALISDDSALRLKLAAYGMALIIGALNYSHYMHPGWRPTVAAVTFGMMSVISPWLWSANSRRTSRDELKARGLIESHAVRLGLTRWFWHALRCCQVMSRATWTGETRPAEAIALVKVPKWMRPAEPVVPAAPAEPVVPAAPAEPVVPAAPAEPVVPAAPAEPVVPAAPAEPVLPTGGKNPDRMSGPDIRTEPGTRRARGLTGLAAARTARERQLIESLTALDPERWPGQNQFARDELNNSRTAAARLFKLARQEIGAVNGHANGS